jgi:FtsH-binding integral membrane protein
MRRFVPALGIVLFQLAVFIGVRPERIASWRECDTQTVALNLARAFEPSNPRVAWGGLVGSVESEPPLYASVVSLLLRVVGDAAWPGQLVAWLCFTGLSLVVFYGVERRYGTGPAVLATSFVLASILGVRLSVTVNPDAMSALLYTASLFATLNYAERGRRRDLLLMHGATLLAAYAKPLALQIGVFQALGLLLGRRERLRDPWLWVGWLIVVAAVLAWIAHGHRIYLDTGNTFGVFSGGDTKAPHLSHLMMPGLHVQLALSELALGVSLLGALSFAYLLVRRKLDSFEWAALVAVTLGLYASFRYSSQPGMGPHYHVFALLHGALFVGHAFAELERQGTRPVIWARGMAGIVCLGMLSAGLLLQREEQRVAESSEALWLGTFLRSRIAPDSLIVVRSPKPEYDEFWERRNNYEEPVAFYAARARGFVLPRDRRGVDDLSRLVACGARHYVEPGERLDDPALYAFLEQRGRPLLEDARGRIYVIDDVSGLDRPRNEDCRVRDRVAVTAR